MVRNPDEAAKTAKAPFDYVLLCVKALPDVYDLAAIIEPVVAPQHTCILVNTTHSLGVESYLEQRFPTNVVLSLVSGAELSQLGPSEFEHKGTSEVWVGPANKNPSIPASIQSDMAEALAMTLASGQVDCKVSSNIRQQQYERMIGYVSFQRRTEKKALLRETRLTELNRAIAFHPVSVLFETPNHTELLEKTGARSLIMGVMDELLNLASAQGCHFPQDFRELTIESMLQPTPAPSTMYQDFTARRPLEIETFLGAPIKLAQDAGVQVPRIETLYALLHNANVVNQTRPLHPSPKPQAGMQQPRGPPGSAPRGPNGPMPGPMGRGGPMRPPGSRAPSMGGMPPPQMRRGPSMNGYPPRMMNGNGSRGPPPGPQMQRRPSMEGNDLEEFSHLMLYDGMPEGVMPEAAGGPYTEGHPTPSSSGDLALREREMALRQREMALREQEYGMRQRRMPPPPASHAGGYDEDDEDGEDYFDPMAANRNVPVIDPDNFDMMSVTSRRTRKAPSASQLRTNPEMGGPQGKQGRGGYARPRAQQRTSARLMSEVPGLHDSIMNNAMMGYSSDRYGNVDRHTLGQESRTNSLTAERLNELQRGGGGPYPNPGGPHPGGPMAPMGRRASQSPGHPLGPPGNNFGPPGRPMQPPNGYHPNGNHVNGNHANGVPTGMRAPLPRHPPGLGNTVAPQQVEQQVGVSTLYPPKSGPQVRSLTGSASASAGSGDSNRSAPIDSDPSAHSSSSSLGPRPVDVQHQ